MNEPNTNSESTQFSTFIVGGQMYGIDVKHVQEIVKPMPMTIVPKAPGSIRGLINLRGQVATAVGLRELFQLEPLAGEEPMNVVCKFDDALVAIQVDHISEVVEVDQTTFSDTPGTVPVYIRELLSGVHKISGRILCILNIVKVLKEINQAA